MPELTEMLQEAWIMPDEIVKLRITDDKSRGHKLPNIQTEYGTVSFRNHITPSRHLNPLLLLCN